MVWKCHVIWGLSCDWTTLFLFNGRCGTRVTKRPSGKPLFGDILLLCKTRVVEATYVHCRSDFWKETTKQATKKTGSTPTKTRAWSLYIAECKQTFINFLPGRVDYRATTNLKLKIKHALLCPIHSAINLKVYCFNNFVWVNFIWLLSTLVDSASRLSKLINLYAT